MPPFTLVGATTRTGMITGPLRDRFGLVARLDYYDAAELEAIVARAAGILAVTIDEPAALGDRPPRPGDATHRQPPAAPGARLRRGPRRRHDRRRHGPRRAGACSASTTSGWTRSTGPILGALCQQFGGGPVGLSTLAIAVGEQTETVEDVYEPFLIQQGLLVRTPRGRVAMPAAYEHLGLAPPATAPATGTPASSTDAPLRGFVHRRAWRGATPQVALGCSKPSDGQRGEVGGEEGDRLGPRRGGRRLVVEHRRLVVVEGVAGLLDVEHQTRSLADRRRDGLDPLERDVGVVRPKWNSIGHSTWSSSSSIAGTPEP